MSSDCKCHGHEHGHVHAEPQFKLLVPSMGIIKKADGHYDEPIYIGPKSSFVRDVNNKEHQTLRLLSNTHKKSLLDTYFQEDPYILKEQPTVPKESTVPKEYLSKATSMRDNDAARKIMKNDLSFHELPSGTTVRFPAGTVILISEADGREVCGYVLDVFDVVLV